MNDQIMFLSAPYVHVHVIYEKVRQYYIHVHVCTYTVHVILSRMSILLLFLKEKEKEMNKNINLRYILQMESTGSEGMTDITSLTIELPI